MSLEKIEQQVHEQQQKVEGLRQQVSEAERNFRKLRNEEHNQERSIHAKERRIGDMIQNINDIGSRIIDLPKDDEYRKPVLEQEQKHLQEYVDDETALLEAMRLNLQRIKTLRLEAGEKHTALGSGYASEVKNLEQISKEREKLLEDERAKQEAERLAREEEAKRLEEEQRARKQEEEKAKRLEEEQRARKQEEEKAKRLEAEQRARKQEEARLAQEQKAAKRLKKELLAQERKEARKLEKQQAAEDARVQRSDLVDSLKAQLVDYQIERNKRFSVKDKLSSKDQHNRNEFIKQINSLLDAYVDSNNSDRLINKITNEIDKYPGLHLQTTLHRLVLALVEPTPPNDLSETAKSILKMQAKQHGDYVNKINNLYKEIDSMHQYAPKLQDPMEREIVGKLASQLKQDVDHFISQHPQKLPESKEFNRFTAKFNARLHSEDIIMSRQENWKSFAINLFLALISVGIALGIKAIHSKLTSGKVGFFAAESKKQEVISNIQETFDDITPPTDNIKPSTQ